MYFAPYIDKTGLHIPTYNSIKEELIKDAKNIFGQDIYLENDSQDYQWIATISEKIYDALQLAQQVYNNRSPSTATQNGLDTIVKINGIKRHSQSFSKVPITVSGVSGTVINNGIVTDKGNIKWRLPNKVIIPDKGQIDVIATCELPGPILANKGDITGIYNPTYGWNGVFNNESSQPGSYVEDDFKLRKRQANSTAQASLTLLEGTAGAIADIKDVTRSKVYENDTNNIDEKGLPPHSITAVVEGGMDKDIATQIWHHKGIGCFSNGDIVVAIEDSRGQKAPIRFFRPKYCDVIISISIKPLSGYTTDTTKKIKENIQNYINALEIGASLSISALWGVALQAMPDLTTPMFSITSITAAKQGETQQSKDIELGFRDVCRCSLENITATLI